MNKLSGIKIIKGKKKVKAAKAKIILYKRPHKITEIFTPGCIGHASVIRPDGIGPNVPDRIYVEDFLVDNSGLSKGGESINPLIQMGLNNSQYIVYSILPEACKKKFAVRLPAGINRGHFSIHLGRKALHQQPLNEPGNINIYNVTITFIDLKGPAPEIDYSAFSITEENNNNFYVQVSGHYTKQFSFTGIQIQCKYPKRDLLPEFDFYKTSKRARAFSVAAENFVLFSYNSRNLVDLGPIISIV